MNATERRLLDEVLEYPGEDLPRLVLADWLEEQGDADRCEFVRVQIELAELDGGKDCPCCGWTYRQFGCQPGSCSYRPLPHDSTYPIWRKRQEHYHWLRERERELWEELRPRFIAELPDGFSASLADPVSSVHRTGFAIFRRGFADEVRMERLADWMGGEKCSCRMYGRDGWILGDKGQWARCSRCCDGTLHGIGPALCAAQPVQRVVTEKRPLQTGPYRAWYSSGNGLTPEAAIIPEPVFSLLKPHSLSSGSSQIVHFWSEQAARDALECHALIRAARNEMKNNAC